MRKIRLRLIAFIVTLAMVLSTSGAFACTAVHIGKNVSKEGTTIIARSEDQGGGAYNKMFKVEPRVTKAGRYFEDTGTGFKVKLPKTTFKYTYVPDASDANDGMYPASCTNEYGVSIVGTVSTGVTDEYAAIDPLTDYDKGLREAILPAIIAGQAKTAKQAAQICCDLHDEYGAAENNTLLFADKNGAWIFENYGGHSYCAMKLSPNKVSVFGNHIMIGWVDSATTSKNYIFSKDLFKNLDKVKNVVKKDGTKYNIVKSIDEPTRNEYSNMRNWEGMRLLAGEKAAGEYSDETFYPLQYKPSGKVSVLDVMDLYRDRYEGTPYDMMLPENSARRPIGVTRQSDVHIMQVFSDLPRDCNTVQWLAMGNAESSVFVPAFSGITDTHDAYKVDGTAYDPDSAWWMFKRIATLAQSDRGHLMKGTQTFWKAQEKSELKKVNKALKEIKKAYKKSKKEGRKYVTKLGKNMASKQLKNSDVLYNALEYITTNNDNDRAYGEGDRRQDFARPVALVKAAKKAGYKVKVDGNKYNLTKDGVTYTLVLNSKEYRVDGAYTDDMAYAVFKCHGTVWAPGNFADYLK